jgi:hypothetical protein
VEIPTAAQASRAVRPAHCCCHADDDHDDDDGAQSRAGEGPRLTAYGCPPLRLLLMTALLANPVPTQCHPRPAPAPDCDGLPLCATIPIAWRALDVATPPPQRRAA